MSTHMADESHTPGPWIVDGLTIESVPGGNICLLNLARQKAATDANARLIAAAPTMFDYVKSRAALGCSEAQQLLKSIHVSR